MYEVTVPSKTKRHAVRVEHTTNLKKICQKVTDPKTPLSLNNSVNPDSSVSAVRNSLAGNVQSPQTHSSPAEISEIPTEAPHLRRSDRIKEKKQGAEDTVNAAAVSRDTEDRRENEKKACGPRSRQDRAS